MQAKHQRPPLRPSSKDDPPKGIRYPREPGPTSHLLHLWNSRSCLIASPLWGTIREFKRKGDRRATRSVTANISPKRNRKAPICFSPHLYHARNLVERFFNKVKDCRRVATRYDKLAANYPRILPAGVHPPIGARFMSSRPSCDARRRTEVSQEQTGFFRPSSHPCGRLRLTRQLRTIALLNVSFGSEADVVAASVRRLVDP